MKSILLDMTSLLGEARQAVSIHVQNALFNLGLGWGGISYSVQQTDADVISVQHIDGLQEGKSGIYFFPSGTFDDRVRAAEIHQNKSVILDAASNVGEFLKQVKENHVGIVVKFEGVPVRVTREGIKIDATDLLKRVEKQAQEFRKQRFGVSE